jgi:alpha-N-arabinofuranosidase
MESNTIIVNVVNRHQDKSITADIINSSHDITGKAIASLITGDKLNDAFTFDQYTQYQPATKEISVKNNKLACTFPPHSFTQIKIGVKKNG